MLKYKQVDVPFIDEANNSSFYVWQMFLENPITNFSKVKNLRLLPDHNKAISYAVILKSLTSEIYIGFGDCPHLCVCWTLGSFNVERTLPILPWLLNGGGGGQLPHCVPLGGKRGHGGRVVTLSPPTSAAGVRSP